MAALVVLPVATAERAVAFGGRPTAALKRSTFLPLLHGPFQMADGRGNSVAVVLTAICDLGPSTVPGDENRFSLMFDRPLSHPGPQGIYHFHHPRIGTADLFAVPVDRAISTRHFQVIVNRSA